MKPNYKQPMSGIFSRLSVDLFHICWQELKLIGGLWGQEGGRRPFLSRPSYFEISAAWAQILELEAFWTVIRAQTLILLQPRMNYSTFSAWFPDPLSRDNDPDLRRLAYELNIWDDWSHRQAEWSTQFLTDIVTLSTQITKNYFC